jgi:hypothetical protein
LLHFFLPEKIAIWDSVLGRSFGLVHQYQFHREDRFITYIAAVHEAADFMDTPWEKLDMAAGDSNCKVSNIRRIEFALYAFGRQRSRLFQRTLTTRQKAKLARSTSCTTTKQAKRNGAQSPNRYLRRSKVTSVIDSSVQPVSFVAKARQSLSRF